MENANTEIVKSTSVLVRNVDDLGRIGKMLAASKYFEDAADVAKSSVKVMAGMEMGFGPFASMTGIHIIKGKPAVGANLMAAAVKSNPRYDYRVRKMEDDEVSVEFFERMDGKWDSLGISTFSAKDATKAGTQNMGKFPRNMLFARAISNGIKWYCPDVFAGNPTYVPEELGAEVDDDGNVVSVPQIENTTEVPDYIEGEAVEIEKPAEKPSKKQFDEEEYLRNYSQPQNVMKMAYNNAKTYRSESKDMLYDDMGTKDLYCHWLGLARKLKTATDQNEIDGIGLKIAAIASIMWHRKMDLTVAAPDPDPFVNQN